VANKRKQERIRSVNFVAKDGRLYRTLDVSLQGMLLEMDDPPPLGSRVAITVAFGERVVGLTGEVVRQESRGRGRTGVGVRFHALPSKARWAIEEHLVAKKRKWE
jgi:hypothetical protein